MTRAGAHEYGPPKAEYKRPLVTPAPPRLIPRPKRRSVPDGARINTAATPLLRPVPTATTRGSSLLGKERFGFVRGVKLKCIEKIVVVNFPGSFCVQYAHQIFDLLIRDLLAERRVDRANA